MNIHNKLKHLGFKSIKNLIVIYDFYKKRNVFIDPIIHYKLEGDIEKLSKHQIENRWVKTYLYEFTNETSIVVTVFKQLDATIHIQVDNNIKTYKRSNILSKNEIIDLLPKELKRHFKLSQLLF